MAIVGNLNKVSRFLAIYGLGRTLFKVAGRSRRLFSILRPSPKKVRDIGVIGCGQFAFATIGYILYRQGGNRFSDCFDVDPVAGQTFREFYQINSSSNDALEVIQNPNTRLIYIASNHASHTAYAIEALKAGKAVYVEKPISVTHEQFERLLKAVRATRGTIYAGYNRPFSPAVRRLKTEPLRGRGPLTLSCFVSGHQIPTEHWYRHPEEGTRICGNVGHWLDLAVHILSWEELPDQWRIMLAYSSEESRDDDLAITLTSERGDLLNIVLTARSEPFEGINETINFQQGSVIAKIDDFRRMTVWSAKKVQTFRYWPKDVGHYAAISQPFAKTARNWREVELSTLLMLFIKDMVVSGQRDATFSFVSEWRKLGIE